MDWKKLIGFGVLIWILMFVTVSIFIAYDVYKFIWMQVIIAVIAGIIAFILAGVVKPSKIALALGYGLIWVIIGLVLDAVVTARFISEIFASWSLWLGYLLVLLAPVLRVKENPEALQTEAPNGIPN